MCTVAPQAVRPDMPIYAAEPSRADDCARSMATGERVLLEAYPDTVADGLRTSMGDLTWPIIRGEPVLAGPPSYRHNPASPRGSPSPAKPRTTPLTFVHARACHAVKIMSPGCSPWTRMR